MNLYSIPPLATAILFLLLGLFCLSRSRQRQDVIAFTLLCLVTFVWQFSWFILFNTTSPNLAMMITRIGYSGIIFIPITYFHFMVSFLKIQNYQKIVKFFYIIAGVFVILLWKSNYFVNGYYQYYWGYYPRASFLHPLHLLQVFVVTIWMLYLLVKNIRHVSSDPRRFNQLKYVILGILFYFPSASDYIVNYGVEFYPVGFIFISVFAGITAYAITRHHLLDIEVIIKKSLVFAGMFVFAFGVFVTVTLLVSQFVGGGRIISLAISALIITIGLRPLETWLVNSTDKFLFQKKYEYKQILRAFIDEVITVLNLDEIVSQTLELLDRTLHPYTAGIIILNKAEDKYQLYNSLGLEDKNIVFTSESKLVIFFKQSHQPAVIRQINGITGASPDIQQELSKIKAVICLPLLLHDDLIGFISLGRKRSDEDYTKDDLDVLLDLARTESIAVGNAQLLTEAAQAERRAAIGTMAAGINHEIGNPLNIMSTKIQLFKIARQKGLLREKTIDQALDQAEEALDECLKQSGRISGITKKLSNFAKPSKEFKPQLLNIPEEIDETLAVVGYDIDLEKIKITRNFASGLFKILADRQEIQQVFFNIVRNAAQAIEGAGTITISVFNTDNGKLRIEIQDSGKGIPEDKVHRVFEPFFTTKGTNKGTGLGLSIVRQLVWRNKGEISFTSQAGAGTTFILEFHRGE